MCEMYFSGCECKRCTEQRASVQRIRQMKAEWPTPEYDWADLEAADKRSRETPEWYKQGIQGR